MNPFRHLLLGAGNQPPLGTWLVSASALLAEAAGHAGFDFGVIDMEHGPLDMADVVHLLQAVAATRMVPLLRVPWNDTVTIKRVLDAGATTLLVPFVQNAAEAAAAVAATRYPPQGVRGMMGMSRAARYGMQADYLTHANRDIALVVQVETEAALAELPAIAAVDGVDAIFVGPADLSASMGLPGQLRHARVMEAMTGVAQQCRALGKPVGSVGSELEVLAQYRAAGFDFIAVDSDLGLFMQGARSALRALRGREGEHVHDLAAGTRES
ncbi:MAG: 2-dehydro-3-deoxyglucarate aldolase [Burkholderiales bacterium]|nr:2-dehydro-3-deoxyglucarate aldolase [Burkholderiales bacterium]